MRSIRNFIAAFDERRPGAAIIAMKEELARSLGASFATRF
jgi:hypothetical protein